MTTGSSPVDGTPRELTSFRQQTSTASSHDSSSRFGITSKFEEDKRWKKPAVEELVVDGTRMLNLLKAVLRDLDATAAAADTTDAATSTHASTGASVGPRPVTSDVPQGEVSKPRMEKLSQTELALKLDAAKDLEQHLLDVLEKLEGATGRKEGESSDQLRLHEVSSWEELKRRRHKLLRNRLRRKKLRRRAAVGRSQEKNKFDEADQKADQWRAQQIAKDIALRKMQHMKQVAADKAREDRLQLEEELEMMLMVEKLQELRHLRVEKLRRQGHLLPEEDDNFLARVQASVEEEEQRAAGNDLLEERQTGSQELTRDSEVGEGGPLSTLGDAAEHIIDGPEDGDTEASQAASTREPQDAQVNACKSSITVGGSEEPVMSASRHDEEGEKGSISRHAVEGAGGETEVGGKPLMGISEAREADGVDKEVDDHCLPAPFQAYYFGSTTSLASLIEVRKQWDAYIVSNGSRIPPHWVDVSPPSDATWASFLIKEENVFPALSD
eukprot:SM000164S02272  [mRNA]  locus=s164:311681:315274:+ [translate_table: standard]